MSPILAHFPVSAQAFSLHQSPLDYKEIKSVSPKGN